MAELVWDEVGSRTYERGLDRGVLYLPDGSAVPWNGLQSVVESFDSEVTPVYFDGMKINDLVSVGSFAAAMSAITYPDEFSELEGLAEDEHGGIFYGNQRPKLFGLCYRSGVGNDIAPDFAGYKIHILYNVLAIPTTKSYETLSDDVTPSIFEWNITAIPEEIPGFRPTAHVELDTRKIDPWLLEEIEASLYGSSGADASLVPLLTLATMIRDWYRIKITDNGDGTWTAEEHRPEFITINLVDESFVITGANAVYLDADTFRISDTISESQVT